MTGVDSSKSGGVESVSTLGVIEVTGTVGEKGESVEGMAVMSVPF